MTVSVALLQDDLGGLAQIVLVVVFLLVSGLAKLFKRGQEQQTTRRQPRTYVPPSEPVERELSWEDLLRGRVEPRPAEPEPMAAKTIEGHSARETELAPRGALSELPAEADLETRGGDEVPQRSRGGDETPPMVEGTGVAAPIVAAPGEWVIAGREIGAGTRAAVTSQRTRNERTLARRAARPSGLAEWRRAIVAREVLGPPVALRAVERDLVG